MTWLLWTLVAAGSLNTFAVFTLYATGSNATAPGGPGRFIGSVFSYCIAMWAMWLLGGGV